MIHWNLILRQLTVARQQSLVFVLCVGLALVTMVGINSFGHSVNQGLLRDARKLQAGDVIIVSRQPPSTSLVQAIDPLVDAGEAETTLVHEFFTMARVVQDDLSLLVELKVVEPGYPFYGTVELGSGDELDHVLTPGTIVVEQLVLDRLGLSVKDSIRIGEAVLRIGDVLVNDPARPVSFFAFGPRILVTSADLERLDLVKPGSRVRYRTLLKVNAEQRIEGIATAIRAAADPALERVSTYRSARSGIQRFFDNLLYFLSLLAVFILILAGIGIESAVTALLRDRENTIAILKALGATNRFVMVHFLWVIAILGTLGTLLGLMGGLGVQWLFPVLLSSFLPQDMTLEFSWLVVAESILLSAVVIGVFTFLPLNRLKELRPSYILRRETIPVPRDAAFYATLGLLVLFFVAMVLWQLPGLRRSLYFVGGALLLLLVVAAATEGTLWALRRQHVRRLSLRQALRGLFRPRNATRAMMISLAAALSVVYTIYLVEQNLDAAFVSAYPEDSPNVIFIDIQPNQRDGFRRTIQAEVGDMLENPLVFYPVVRGHLTSINSQLIDRQQERRRRGDNLARQFNLTYRDELLADETLIQGKSLFNSNIDGVQVSLLDDLLEMQDFKIGDVITLRIQGVPLEATVTSIRSRTSESISPFFYFVFPPNVLAEAPQSIFTTVRIPVEAIGTLQNRMVAEFPNVSVIDVTKAVAAFADLAQKLSGVIRLLAGFSITAGLLIIVSSVHATRFARIQEAVYFKVLGATKRFVLIVFATETMILGLVSAGIAFALAQIGSWALCHWVFEIRYQPNLTAGSLLVLLTVLLVSIVGLVASIGILRKRPISFLREQSQE